MLSGLVRWFESLDDRRVNSMPASADCRATLWGLVQALINRRSVGAYTVGFNTTWWHKKSRPRENESTGQTVQKVDQNFSGHVPIKAAKGFSMAIFWFHKTGSWVLDAQVVANQPTESLVG